MWVSPQEETLVTSDLSHQLQEKYSSERHDTRQERMAEGSEVSELSDLTDKLGVSNA